MSQNHDGSVFASQDLSIASSQFHQQILDSSDDCIQVLDLEGRILFMNRRGQELLGIEDITPFLNTSWTNFWSTTQLAIKALCVAKAGEVSTFQGYCPTLFGEGKWWDIKVSPIRGADGQVESLLCVSRDITERIHSENECKLVQELLRKSEARLSAIFSQAKIGLCEISLDGHFQRVNDELCRILGRAREEILTASIFDVTHPEDIPQTLKALATLIQTKEAISLDKRYLRLDGTIVWANSSLSCLDDEQGNARAILAATVDLSERKHIEAALNEQHRLYESVLTTTPDLAYVFDLNHRFIYANQGLLKMWGKTWDEAIGRNCLELGYEPWHAQMHDQEIEQVIATRQPIRGEVPFTGSFGRRIYDYIFTPVFDEQGQVVAVAGTTRDITESKRREANAAFLAEIADDFSRLSSADEIMQKLGAKIGAYLDITTCSFTDVDEARGEVTVHYGWNSNEVPSTVGTFCIKDYLSQEFKRASRCGETVVIRDTQNDPRTDADGYAALKIHSFVTVPFHRNGRWTHCIAICDSRPRDWRDDEIELIEEIANRIFPRLERARTEAVLREREQRLSIATEAAQLGIFEWRVPEDVTIWENHRMYELFGLTPADGSVSSQEFFNSYLHPDDAQAFGAKFTQALQTGSLRQTSYRICRPDGTIRWLEVNGQFEYALDGSPLRFVGVNADITARKTAEATIVQREAQFRQLADAIPQQVWITDAQGKTQYVNQQWTTYTGLTREQTQDIHYAAEVIHPDDFESARQLWSIALATGTPYQAEFRLQHHADNTYRWFLSRAIAIRDEHEQIVQWFGTSTDIEEFKRTQSQREQLLQREQTAREAAENANRIKDEFLAVLSHELRSPLNPILGWSRLLQKTKLDEAKIQQALSTIERNAKLQVELIEDLLDVSRILQGKLTLTSSPIHLVSTIKAALETVQLSAEAKSISLEVNLDTNVGVVLGDSTRLQQVIWNLLSNAIKFTPTGGQVVVRLSQVDNQAKIIVSDTGKGISPDFLPYVFDYFRQADSTTTRKFGGLGLGLAIVRHLVELHGGTIMAHSQGEGSGATFTVEFPLMSTQPIANSDSPLSEASLSLHDIQVLIVDDDTNTRNFVAFLVEQAGAKVITAASAYQALQLLTQAQPDILLSDIGMPDMDGYMLMRQIRALPPEQGGGIKAIALTAYAGELDEHQALKAGFQKHLAKPVEPENLIAAITNLLAV